MSNDTAKSLLEEYKRKLRRLEELQKEVRELRLKLAFIPGGKEIDVDLEEYRRLEEQYIAKLRELETLQREIKELQDKLAELGVTPEDPTSERISTPRVELRKPEVPQLIKYTPEDVERLADILALIVIAFGIMQAGSWFGKDNWIVAVAIGAAIAYLAINYNGPVRVFLRKIFQAVLEALIELINGMYAWIYLAGEYYGGNFLRMLVDIVVWTVAGYIFSQFIRFPAVKQFWDTLNQIIRTIFETARQWIDAVRSFVEQTRDWILQRIADLFGALDRLAQEVSSRFGILQEFFLQQLRAGLLEMKTWTELTIKEPFERALNKIEGQLDLLDQAMKDTTRWILAQVGAIRVQIADIVVTVPLVALYDWWIAQQTAQQAPTAYLEVMFESGRAEGPDESTDPLVLAMWALEDVDKMITKTHEVVAINEIRDHIDEAFAIFERPSPPPVAA